jgi:hypothetical protein
MHVAVSDSVTSLELWSGLFNSEQLRTDDHRVPNEILELSGAGQPPTRAPFYVDAPEATTAWPRITMGEQRLATRLTESLADRAVVLHNRQFAVASRAIDHLIVGPTGIWVIEATSDSGRVECRDRGSWSKSDDCLFVGGRNRTHLLADVTATIAAVRRALEPAGYAGSPMHAAICFTSATWPPLCRAFQLDGVWVSEASTLVEQILGAQSFSDAAIETVGHELRQQLTSA